MFIAALFAITKNWKQARQPSVGEQLNKLVHPDYAGGYSAIKTTIDISDLDESQVNYA